MPQQTSAGILSLKNIGMIRFRTPKLLNEFGYFLSQNFLIKEVFLIYKKRTFINLIFIKFKMTIHISDKRHFPTSNVAYQRTQTASTYRADATYFHINRKVQAVRYAIPQNSKWRHLQPSSSLARTTQLHLIPD